MCIHQPRLQFRVFPSIVGDRLFLGLHCSRNDCTNCWYRDKNNKLKFTVFFDYKEFCDLFVYKPKAKKLKLCDIRNGECSAIVKKTEEDNIFVVHLWKCYSAKPIGYESYPYILSFNLIQSFVEKNYEFSLTGVINKMVNDENLVSDTENEVNENK